MQGLHASAADVECGILKGINMWVASACDAVEICSQHSLVGPLQAGMRQFFKGDSGASVPFVQFSRSA